MRVSQPPCYNRKFFGGNFINSITVLRLTILVYLSVLDVGLLNNTFVLKFVNSSD